MTWLAACAVERAGRPLVPAGMYELEAAVGDRTFPVRLELLSIGGEPWGRLTVVAGRELVSAVRGTGRTGDEWDFAVGGPVRSMQLLFPDDRVAGTIVMGQGPPIAVEGRRTGPLEAADELRAHHGLEPLGIAERAGESTFANEYGAWVSPLDNHLYFTSDRYGHADIFRVNARAAGVPPARQDPDSPAAR